MDKKSKIIICIFITAIIALLSYEYFMLVIKNNYVIKTYTSCDQTKYSCFIQTCTEDEIDCDDSVYAKITKNIINNNLCNQYKAECPDLTCAIGESNCEITYCSLDNVEEGEKCVSGMMSESKDEATTVEESATTTNNNESVL